MAAILVANGHGDIAVSKPGKNAVITGTELLSNNDCSHSIKLIF